MPVGDCQHQLENGNRCKGAAVRGTIHCRHHAPEVRAARLPLALRKSRPNSRPRLAQWENFEHSASMLEREELPDALAMLADALTAKELTRYRAARILRAFSMRLQDEIGDEIGARPEEKTPSLPPELAKLLLSPQI